MNKELLIAKLQEIAHDHNLKVEITSTGFPADNRFFVKNSETWGTSMNKDEFNEFKQICQDAGFAVYASYWYFQHEKQIQVSYIFADYGAK